MHTLRSNESDKKLLKCNCGDDAIAFFPEFDPDVKSHPYCEKCLRVTKIAMMIKLQSINQKYENEQDEFE